MRFINKCFTAIKSSAFIRVFQLWLFLPVFLIPAGCKKLVEVSTPPTNLSSQNVYLNDATAIAAVTAIYSSINNSGPYESQLIGMTGLTGLSADELTLYAGTPDGVLRQYYRNELTSQGGLDFWTQAYQNLFIANAAIEHLTNNSALSSEVQRQLMGEAKFSRALLYFYLVNLYGDIPLVVTTDYLTNEAIGRSPQSQVWRQIIQDLAEAATLLSSDYLDATLLNKTPEKLRPTSWAATSLLARTYLYTGNWAGADSAASAVINSGKYILNSPDSVFFKNSSEAIWQLQPVSNNGTGFNTRDAFNFILHSNGPDGSDRPAYLNDSLVTSFESGDLRKAYWINSVTTSDATYYYAYKYKNDSIAGPVTEYTMVFRLAELYLIRAEARAQLNDLPKAVDDLNTIRSRAGLPARTVGSQSELLAAVLSERRFEFFTEWGHRWLDLKRTGSIDTVMGGPSGASVSKGATWNTNAQWFPIPSRDLQKNTSLTQNAGY